MARLADDWQEQRQQCIDVLCAYLRMPAEDDGDLSEREVRATIVRTVAAHLREGAAINWSKHDFDFTGAALHHAVFRDARFSGKRTIFYKATFSGEFTNFRNATFSGEFTIFDRATFSGEQTRFEGATFCGQQAGFDHATFSARFTIFDEATFSAESSTFTEATFSGQQTTFYKATFSGKSTTFTRATFSGRFTIFDEATFSGGTPADEATVESSFVGSTVVWGPITPRTLPSTASKAR